MTFFSVVIPTYNRAHLIGDTLDSVLNQSFENFEVLIIDDQSTDNTKDILDQYCLKDKRVRYFYKQNGERGAARNFGFSHAAGRYVAFLDSDDLWRKDHLSAMFEVLIKREDINFIACKYDFQRSNKFYPSELNELKEGFYDLNIVLKGNPFSCNFCVKRNNEHLLLFREEREFVIIEDWVFLVENLYKDRIYLVDINSSILVDHPARSMRGSYKNIINKRLYAMNWLCGKYDLSKNKINIIKGYSYYFCAIHCFIDNFRLEGLKFNTKALQYIGLKTKILVMYVKLLLGIDILNRILKR